MGSGKPKAEQLSEGTARSREWTGPTDKSVAAAAFRCVGLRARSGSAGAATETTGGCMEHVPTELPGHLSASYS